MALKKSSLQRRRRRQAALHPCIRQHISVQGALSCLGCRTFCYVRRGCCAVRRCMAFTLGHAAHARMPDSSVSVPHSPQNGHHSFKPALC